MESINRLKDFVYKAVFRDGYAIRLTTDTEAQYWHLILKKVLPREYIQRVPLGPYYDVERDGKFINVYRSYPHRKSLPIKTKWGRNRPDGKQFFEAFYEKIKDRIDKYVVEIESLPVPEVNKDLSKHKPSTRSPTHSYFYSQQNLFD